MYADLLDNIVVVLHRPEDPVNIGAIVRAMKNMGFSRLRLVQPVAYQAADLLRVAHRCEDIVDRIEGFASLDDALADMHFVIGTAAIDHPDRRVTGDIRTLARDLAQRAAGARVALLFGPEADGLDRAALDRCHLIASLPANPAYPALNLAQSVLLFLYEVRMAAVDVLPAPAPLAVAEQAALERLFQATEATLHAAGFFRYDPAAVMRTLRQIAYRAELQPADVALLLAIVRKLGRVAAGHGVGEVE
jgi:TrmH family RNA methyltransferase